MDLNNMKMMILSISLLFSQFLLANEFTIDSTFGVHKGMTKTEIEKITTLQKQLDTEKPDFYCVDYISSYAPTKTNFDYYIYTFYKNNELIGITGVKKNEGNAFFNKLLSLIKNKYGQEKVTNTNYPSENYYYYHWDLNNDGLSSISFYNFFKQHPQIIKLSYFFKPAITCLKK